MLSAEHEGTSSSNVLSCTTKNTEARKLLKHNILVVFLLCVDSISKPLAKQSRVGTWHCYVLSNFLVLAWLRACGEAEQLYVGDL
jgi:hypothetical protein